jgi:hypothetical protein
MATNSGFLGLPDAVLVQICSQFCPHCAGEDCIGGFELPERFWGPGYWGTLATLAQVNVRVARLAQQVRLHVVSGRRVPWGFSMTRLIRTLLDAPDLAQHIRVVRLGHRDGNQEWVGVWGGARGVWGEETPHARPSPRQLDTLRALELVPEVGQSLLEKFRALPPTEDTVFFGHEQGTVSPYFLHGAKPGTAPTDEVCCHVVADHAHARESG